MYVRGEMIAVNIKYIHIFYDILHCDMFRLFKEANIRHCKYIKKDYYMNGNKTFILPYIWSHLYNVLCVFFLWHYGPTRAKASSFTRFLDHTQRRTTVGRTSLDEWSARHKDLYLTAHNTHNRQTSMPPGGIRTHNLSRRATADLRLRPRGHWDRRFVL